MKKLGLVSALSLGLVVLAGCTTSKPVAITNSDDMVNLYNESKAMTCTLEFSDNEGSAVYSMYFKDGMIYQLSKEKTADGEEYTDYALARDGMMYGWGDSYGDAGMYLEYEMNIDDELAELYGSLEDAENLTCVKGVKDTSVFNKPSNVEFTSLSDIFGNIEYDEEYFGDEYDEEYVEENNEENVEENNEENVEENNEEVVAEDNGEVGGEDGIE